MEGREGEREGERGRKGGEGGREGGREKKRERSRKEREKKSERGDLSKKTLYSTKFTDFQLFVHLVSEIAEEVVGILLFSDVDWLAPEFKGLPEALRSIVLQFAFQ